MKVVYTAPNRSHHYKYAAALNAAGCLHAFVSGFPRISPRAKAVGLDGKLYRSDFLQTIYISSLKAKLPEKVCNFLAFLAKIEQDFACHKFVSTCDVFLFYNGSGLNSCRYGKKNGAICIVEVVNSHVDYQESILHAEYRNLNLTWKPFPKFDKKRRLKEYEEADYILLPSEFVKRSFLEKGVLESKLLKVPYGFNKITTYAAKFTEICTKDHFTILYVGSISVRKGVRYLIEAFKKLRHPKKKLLIVGPNMEDGALDRCTLPSDIIFTGILKGAELDNVYSSAQVFCLPSIEDGFGLVLGEALSFGLPIITTYNTGADEIVKEGVEGYIVPIRDSEAIFQKLQLLADHPDLLEYLRYNSRIKSNKLDGWKEAGNNLVEILSKVYDQR